MITVTTQLHGYRQGHQLLDSTISLSKADQLLVDRLSDIAGPLRPGERFEPYLSAYPLPSGHFYVLARTWQDATVPRDGCVKTLSLIIPSDEWKDAHNLQPFINFLDPAVFPVAASVTALVETPLVPLPSPPEFCATELLEALFLEDPKPIALFDAPSPELIAARLLTALWPVLRSRFALTTFALSPRKIGGRNFDLVFAPKNARSKFADWPGRRIDARAGTPARHRWTGEIVQRVFQSRKPYLLDDRETRLVGEDDIDSAAALRIVLLWDELLAKLEQSPSAALGLIDIAISKMQSGSTALRELQPALSIATQCAAQQLPEAEAWEFFRAMARKISGTPLISAFPFVMDAVSLLTDRSPASAIALLDQVGEEEAIKALVPSVAAGLALHFNETGAKALEEARLPTFRELILADKDLAQAILTRPILVDRLAKMIGDLNQPLFEWLRDGILPAIVNDTHAILAHHFFGSLSIAGIIAEINHLNKVTRFKSMSLIPPLIERGRQLSAIEEIRNTLLSIAPSPGRNEFLRMTLSPSTEDTWWLLMQTGLNNRATNMLLQDIFRQADSQQFRNLLSDVSQAPDILKRFEGKRDLLLRAVADGGLQLTLRVPIVMQLLEKSDAQQKRELVTNLLDDCLRAHFGGDESATLSTLFESLGPVLDGSRVVRTGLGRSVPISVINRNLVAFNALPQQLRLQILGAVEELAERLAARSPLDLDEDAAVACGSLLWEAQSVSSTGLLHGAGRLLPTLLYSIEEPVSSIVAAVFPLVYRELAKENDVPELLKFVPFIDWDRCKTARRKLVETFLSSETWRPGDLALTACRTLDVDRILRRIAKSRHGELYIQRITADLEMLPFPCQDQVKKVIMHIMSD